MRLCQAEGETSNQVGYLALPYSADRTGVIESLRRVDPYILSMRLCLIATVLHGSSAAAANVPIRVVAGLMLVCPDLLTRPVLWWTLTAAVWASNIASWSSIDNHKYLIGYVALTCSLSLSVACPSTWLRDASRQLVGCVFALAVIWKLIAGQYVDGSFFYFTFLQDGRLQRVASAIGSVPTSDLRALTEAIGYLGGMGDVTTFLVVSRLAPLLVTALSMSWLGLLLEAAVGAAFLLKWRIFRMSRHYLLMAFVATTYFLLPVIGFAFVLCILGMSSAPEGAHRVRVSYCVVLACVHLALVPWQSMLLGT
jgi:hypothetical protein